MTRPDLEALAAAIIARANPAAVERAESVGQYAAIIVNAADLAGFFDEIAPLVAAAERLRIVAEIRASEPESVALARERVLSAAARESGAGDLDSLAYEYRSAIRLHHAMTRPTCETPGCGRPIPLEAPAAESDDDLLSRHMADVTRGHKFTPMAKGGPDPRDARIAELEALLESVTKERDGWQALADRAMAGEAKRDALLEECEAILERCVGGPLQGEGALGALLIPALSEEVRARIRAEARECIVAARALLADTAPKAGER